MDTKLHEDSYMFLLVFIDTKAMSIRRISSIGLDLMIIN